MRYRLPQRNKVVDRETWGYADGVVRRGGSLERGRATPARRTTPITDRDIARVNRRRLAVHDVSGRRRIAGGWIVTGQLCPRNNVTRTTILDQGERPAYCSNIGGPLRFAGGEIASCAVHYKSGKGDKQQHQDCCEDEYLTATPSHLRPRACLVPKGCGPSEINDGTKQTKHIRDGPCDGDRD